MAESELKKDVPYIVYESAQVRAERTIKRLTVALIISIFLIFVSHAAWLFFISQYNFESYEYAQDGEGVNIIGDSNGVDYGAEAQNTENNPQE